MLNKPAYQLAAIIACFLIFITKSAIADVRNQSFYKRPNHIKQLISLGGNYDSDYNSKEYDFFAGYRYKSHKYIHEIELNHEVTYKSTTRKNTYKDEELYEAEISSKMLIANSTNYLNFFHNSQRDSFSDYYYKNTTVGGLGRMFFDKKIEIDFNIGHNHMRYGPSEKTYNPTLKVRFDFTKNIKLAMRGYIFMRQRDYDEQLKSRLSFKFNRRISFDIIHSYRKDRYYYKKKDIKINRAKRSYGFRIRYSF